MLWIYFALAAALLVGTLVYSLEQLGQVRGFWEAKLEHDPPVKAVDAVATPYVGKKTGTHSPRGGWVPVFFYLLRRLTV